MPISSPTTHPAPSTARVNFYRFWVGEGVSLFGTATSSVLLPLLAIEELGAGPQWMGLLSAAAWLPWLLIGLPAGAWVDRWPPRLVMIVANLVAAAALASIPAAWRFDVLSLVQLALVALAVGTTAVFFRTAYQRLLPTLVPPGQLENANARIFGTESAMQVAGPGFGGLLTQWGTAALGIVVDAFSYIVSACCLWRIRLPRSVTRTTEHDPEEGLLDRIRAGVRFVVRDQNLRVLLVIGGVSNFGLTGYAALLVLFLVSDLALPAGIVGTVLMIGSLGGVLGAGLAGPLSRRIGSGRASTVLLLIAGPSALLVGLPTTSGQVWLTAAGLVLVGAAVVAGNVIRGAWRMRYVPDTLLGRVVTSTHMINYGTMPFAGLLAGWLGAQVGVRVTILIMAGVVAVASSSVLLAGFGRRKELPEPVCAHGASESGSRGARTPSGVSA
jgi:MFS family permease